MGNEFAVAVCGYCGEKVLASCRRPSHLLHLLMTALTIGFWTPVWAFLAARSMTCRCCQCGGPISLWKADFSATTANLIRPFDRKVPPGPSTGSAVNAMLVKYNLVYYMPTSAPLR